MESNFDAAFVPFPIFTTASLLYRRATYAEAIASLAYQQAKPPNSPVPNYCGCSENTILHSIRNMAPIELYLGRVISQLMACWKLGGSDMHYGWRWVKLIILWILFTVPIQDFRDVPGDLAAGRRTTPILLGDIPGGHSLKHLLLAVRELAREG
ncbi:hypothetical protein An09g01610 [Aspergillus niger]|uniref:Uncharacterized protein n=2 Tax=Aspergillus niger TaxID=5061 RepID=A2QTC6_ASPNC|nr:hypothetical protein An09g01610 [Aspergillus niger]CAK49082.1 hypothetical protein An09g01610 [Aspergillus niger]